METYYISKKFFTKEELTNFKDKFGYEIFEIDYTSSVGEIDFSESSEKEFLFKYGIPKILARFGY